MSGRTHTYTEKKNGGYKPPAGEFGTVALDADGLVTFTADGGTVYEFNASGRVVTATSPQDALKPAAPIATYSGDRITAVNDAVSSDGSGGYTRKVTFTYQDSARTACPAPVPTWRPSTQRCGRGRTSRPSCCSR